METLSMIYYGNDQVQEGDLFRELLHDEKQYGYRRV
jgi:hypothetical protein